MALFSRYKRLGDDPFGQIPDSEADLPGASLPDVYGATSYQDDDRSGDYGNDAPPPIPGTASGSMPPPQPSMRADSMDKAKDLKPVSAAPPNMAPDAPPAPPPGLDGAPKPPKSASQQALDEYTSLKAPDKPKAGLLQKIAAVGLGGLAGWNNVDPRRRAIDPEDAQRSILLGPKYMHDQQQYENKKSDLQNRIKLTNEVADIQSKDASRLETADTRTQNSLNAAAKVGKIFVPKGQQPPPGYIQSVNPHAGTDSPLANADVFVDPNFGKFKVTPEQAALSNGAVSAGQWLPLSEMTQFIKGGVDQGKPAKADFVPVSPSTAKAMNIVAEPNPDGTVSVPTSALNAHNNRETAKPKEIPSNIQIGLKRMGLPANTDINTLTPEQATKLAQFSKADAQEFHISTGGNEGTWSIQEDADGKPIQYNSKTGETRPMQGSVQKAGTKAKQDAAQEKLVGPARDALQYGKDYLAKGVPTGPGDEALMEKFFELAKPSSGFRMTQQQIDMLKHAQGIMNSLQAKVRHATTGTWFSDDLRKQIVGTMEDLGNAKLKGSAPAGGGAQAQGGGKIVVTAPDGSKHPFDTQAQADRFKSLISGGK